MAWLGFGGVKASPEHRLQREDSNYHSYYCWANRWPSWTQGEEVGQLPHTYSGRVFSNVFKPCLMLMGVLPAKAETRAHSAAHSFILLELFRAAPHCLRAPQSLAVSKSSLKTCEFRCGEIESVTTRHCRRLRWQLFVYLKPLAGLWGGSVAHDA